MKDKPDAQEIARLLEETLPHSHVSQWSLMGSVVVSDYLSNAPPDLRRRLAAAIYPESVERKQGDYQTCTTRGCLNTIWRQA